MKKIKYFNQFVFENDDISNKDEANTVNNDDVVKKLNDIKSKVNKELLNNVLTKIKDKELNNIVKDKNLKLEPINEGLLTFISLLGGKILKWSGIATNWLGGKINSNWLKKAGSAMEKYGTKIDHTIHHTVETLIGVITTTLFPNISKETLLKVEKYGAKAFLIYMAAGGAIHSGVETTHAFINADVFNVALNTGMSACESGETICIATEIVGAIAVEYGIN